MARIPAGLCQCGCGGRTSLAPQAIKSKGLLKGEPQRFLRAHCRVKRRCAGCKKAFIATHSHMAFCSKACGRQTALEKRRLGYAEATKRTFEARRRYRQRNKIKLLAYAKQWRADNKWKMLMQHRAWRKRNSQYIVLYRLQQKQKNPNFLAEERDDAWLRRITKIYGLGAMHPSKRRKILDIAGLLLSYKRKIRKVPPSKPCARQGCSNIIKWDHGKHFYSVRFCSHICAGRHKARTAA